MDLPAPFSPISASTSPPHALSWTPFSAFTPGNVLEMPRISSRGVSSLAILSSRSVSLPIVPPVS